MEDKTTPHLKPEGQQAILSGSSFLTGREAHLQARLDELEAELVSLGDAPDDVESLERQALDALRSLSDLLEPPTPAPAPAPPPEPIPALASAARTRPRRSAAGSHQRSWRVAAIIVALLVVGLSALFLVWMYGPDLVGDSALTTTAAQATSTPAPIPPTPAVSSPARPPATTTPIPSPTIVAPHPEGTRPETPGRTRETIQAETVQIFDISGTLGLELPLTAMTETVRLVDGLPVLQPVLPEAGGGLHRGSAPFGQAGTTVVALPAGTAPDSLWRIRPGDRLMGCNTDGKCHDYRVAAAEMWPLDHLRQFLAAWPVDEGVLLYTVADEATAWVIWAEPLREEGTR